MSIAEGVLIKNNKILLVKQKTKRGDVVWNFPGGNIEVGETPEQACARELKEETGYDVKIVLLLNKKKEKKWTYICEILGGIEGFDSTNPENEDLIEIKWVSVESEGYFDNVTKPIIDKIKQTL